MITELLARLQAVAETVEAARQFAVDYTGADPGGEVLRDLDLRWEVLAGEDREGLLGLYVGLSRSEIGGPQFTMDIYLERIAPKVVESLRKRFYRTAEFGLYECVALEADESKWRLVGGGERHLGVDGVTDVTGESVEAEVGDYRVGWRFEIDERAVLAFTIRPAEEALARLLAAAEEEAWTDDDGAFEIAVYERDVLTFALCPEADARPGLPDFYFLPERLRGQVPRLFAWALPSALKYRSYDQRPPWHVHLARRGFEEAFRSYLHLVRNQAYRGTNFWWRCQLEERDLARLVTDDEFAQILGLTPDRQVELPVFTPQNTWPLRILSLDDEWYEASGCTGEDTLYTARKALADSEHLETLEAAVEELMVRQRWITLVTGLYERTEDWPETLRPHLHVNPELYEPTYECLRACLARLFPELRDYPIASLLAGQKGAPRIVKCFKSGGCETLSDLPEADYELELIKGIGPASVEMLMEQFRALLLARPPELTGVTTEEARADGKKELDQGLDELEALF